MQMGDKRTTDPVDLLRNSVQSWNTWRKDNPDILPDLRGANLRGTNLREADLHDSLLNESNLNQADLFGANLTNSNLNKASLVDAKLNYTDLAGSSIRYAVMNDADLTGAFLNQTDLTGTSMRGAILNDAILEDAVLKATDLSRASLINTNLESADLSASRVYGISAWDIRVNNETIQTGLIITPTDDSSVTIDGLELAQFIYLLLNNKKITQVINTIGEKGVLILGRFTPDRLHVLNTIKKKLRELGYLPIMFDFERPNQRDFSETIQILAGLCVFIIADITKPRSSPLELQVTMPDYMIPFVPIIHESDEPFAMYQDLHKKYSSWVLDVLKYDSVENLMMVFEEAIIKPAIKLSNQLILKKAESIRIRHVHDYLSI